MFEHVHVNSFYGIVNLVKLSRRFRCLSLSWLIYLQVPISSARNSIWNQFELISLHSGRYLFSLYEWIVLMFVSKAIESSEMINLYVSLNDMQISGIRLVGKHSIVTVLWFVLWTEGMSVLLSIGHSIMHPSMWIWSVNKIWSSYSTVLVWTSNSISCMYLPM